MKKSEKYSFSAIILNSILFTIKFVAGIYTNSISLISDALNSLSDIFSSIIVYVSIKVANKRPDWNHPFGHHRAETLAGVVVAIFTGILGFEVAKTSIIRTISGKSNLIGDVAAIVLIINILIKLFMANFFIKKGKSMKRPALKATGIDSRNDAIVSFIALIGVGGSFIGFGNLDNIAGIIISLFIFYSGYQIAIENIDYLMGKTPPKKYVDKLVKKAKKVNGVKGINDVRAHYVGNRIHIEIHVEVDANCSTKESHDIGKVVQIKIEKLNDVDKAFVHIDPV
ncbi:cation transporter [archaeon]|nr:cation transporter [archaeon]